MSSTRQQELADFLTTRRQRLQPNQVGLPTTGHRRTPGLRREEVAALAHMSLTWYTWLEQGRDIQVSEQIVTGLVAALKLSPAEATHLFTLTGVNQPTTTPPFTEQINPMLQRTIDSWPLSGVVILDQRWNFVAVNTLTAQFASTIVGHALLHRNLLRELFTDEAFQRVIADWQIVASNMVGRFRQQYATLTTDDELTAFVQQLRADSPLFDQLWQKHDIRPEIERHKTMFFPVVGEVHFDETSFIVGDNVDLRMYVFTPVETDDTIQKIKLSLDHD
ncbi:helix-turn-helix transcriptional regulator [Furfurilactobacillus sp. WILCCON 0119]